MFYKDPVNITPRKFVKVNISAKDDAALARRRYIENNKVDFPHLQEVALSKIKMTDIFLCKS
jgi:hypothetical protein